MTIEHSLGGENHRNGYFHPTEGGKPNEGKERGDITSQRNCAMNHGYFASQVGEIPNAPPSN